LAGGGELFYHLKKAGRFTENRAKFYEQEYKLKDVSFLRSLPPNTIIGRRVRDDTPTGVEDPQYYFPMFPPHLMMPIKAGEHVWAFFEENKVKVLLNRIDYTGRIGVKL
jgi:hypothetical protein